MSCLSQVETVAFQGYIAREREREEEAFFQGDQIGPIFADWAIVYF
jgi:hypothetical protein